MTEIFVQLPTFEIVLALDDELARRIGNEFSEEEQQSRMASILFALRDLGSLTPHDRGVETWFYTDPKEDVGNDVVMLKA